MEVFKRMQNFCDSSVTVYVRKQETWSPRLGGAAGRPLAPLLKTTAKKQHAWRGLDPRPSQASACSSPVVLAGHPVKEAGRVNPGGPVSESPCLALVCEAQSECLWPAKGTSEAEHKSEGITFSGIFLGERGVSLLLGVIDVVVDPLTNVMDVAFMETQLFGLRGSDFGIRARQFHPNTRF
ncbi:hypothetical protein EYF80_039944 [Liparis tanakae]|uniref:Uncharacterized protein n=1 Tax=Liparis tanakae TaxID=230148 RepID=A0A4Z2G979_9TELE|nr:hypothetical protein EYF80_039944 [Liparis tanakae]